MLCAIPLWAGRFLPLYDIPQHLGISNAIAGVFSGDPNFTEYYQVDLWPQPYWLYYLLVLGFSQIGSIELANKIVLLVYSIGVALGVRTMLFAFKRDPRWWLLAVPLAWSTSFFWGFAAYLIGIPLVLFGIAIVESACSSVKPSTKSPWLLGILGCLIYLAHAQAYLWFLFACSLLVLLHWKGPSWSLRILLPLLPSMAGFTLWAWQMFVANKTSPGGVSASAYGTLWNLGMRWEPWSKRVGSFMEQLYGGCTDASNTYLGWIWIGILMAGIAFCLKERRLAFGQSLTCPRWGDYRIEILLLAFILAWLLLPYNIRGQYFLAPRYLVFSGATAIVAAAGSGIWHRRLLVAGILLSAFFSFNMARVIWGFQSAMEGLETVLKHVPPGERVAYFPFDTRIIPPDPSGQGSYNKCMVIDMPTSVSLGGYWTEHPQAPLLMDSPTHHAVAYYQIWSGGDVAFSFAEAASNPLRYRHGKQPEGLNEHVPELVDLKVASKHYGWFLVRGPLRGNAAQLAEYADLVTTQKSWSLWRRRTTP